MSNDNAHIEAVFKTVKYYPAYPYGGFASLVEARKWVYSSVEGYNHFHRHSGIKYVTPDERHAGLDIAILANRRQLLRTSKGSESREMDPWSDQRLGSNLNDKNEWR